MLGEGCCCRRLQVVLAIKEARRERLRAAAGKLSSPSLELVVDGAPMEGGERGGRLWSNYRWNLVMMEGRGKKKHVAAVVVVVAVQQQHL